MGADTLVKVMRLLDVDQAAQLTDDNGEGRRSCSGAPAFAVR